MATPADLVDFAYGFALTEGVAERVEDIREVEIEAVEGGWRVKLALAGERLKAHLARRRAISGRTGCGLCGVEDFDQMPRPLPARGPAPPVAPCGDRPGARRAREPPAAQRADPRRARRGVVRARRADRAGARGCRPAQRARQGDRRALARRAPRPTTGFFVITSRCSFEMVAKAAIFGARTLVAVSAPTSLALDRARALGMTVVAVARKDKALSFCDRGGGAGELAA